MIDFPPLQLGSFPSPQAQQARCSPAVPESKPNCFCSPAFLRGGERERERARSRQEYALSSHKSLELESRPVEHVQRSPVLSPALFKGEHEHVVPCPEIISSSQLFLFKVDCLCIYLYVYLLNDICCEF